MQKLHGLVISIDFKINMTSHRLCYFNTFLHSHYVWLYGFNIIVRNILSIQILQVLIYLHSNYVGFMIITSLLLLIR